MSGYSDEERAAARQRFMLLQVVRFAALGLLLAGIAATRAVIDVPYPAAIAMIGAGMIGFFFGPQMLARKFKASDRSAADRIEKP